MTDIKQVIDAAEIERLTEIAKKATPGPWSWYTPDRGYLADYIITNHPDFEPNKTDRFRHVIAEADSTSVGSVNANHIAAFDPPTALALLSHIAALEAKIEAAESVMEDMNAKLIESGSLFLHDRARITALEAELAEERETRRIERELNDDQLEESERIIGVRNEEITALEAENKDALDEIHKWNSTVSNYAADIAALKAENKALRNLMEPFRRVASINRPIADTWPDDKPAVDFIPGAWPTWKDFRALLQDKPKP